MCIRDRMIAAGDSISTSSLQSGNCIQIMTGAPVPPMANAVVPIEKVKVKQNSTIEFNSAPILNDNIRKAGEDFKKGIRVLNLGQKIQAQHILPLATLGISELKVYKKPRTAFLATGKELVDDLSLKLGSGQIYNSNRPHALATLSAMSTNCIKSYTITDDPKLFDKTLKELMALDLDFIISSLSLIHI